MEKRDQMSSAVSGRHEFVNHWRGIVQEGFQKETKWIEELKRCGVKAAHPNDGWVDRENLKFQLVYPQFNTGVDVGDLVCLGSASEPEKNRIVKVIEIEQGFISLVHYHFEDWNP